MVVIMEIECTPNRPIKGKRISADAFYAAFCEQWAQDIGKDVRLVRSPYYCRKTWTDLICSRDGFLSRVTKRLGAVDSRLAYRTEWYEVDGLIVGGEDVYKSGLAYPSKVYAIIEHELGTDIETEAWKLAHWVSPLKVLIFYDWCDSQKTSYPRSNFLENRKDKFLAVVNKVREFFPEPDGTEYLLIVARRGTPDGPIAWERYI